MNGEMHILLVEDNPGDARLIREMLGERVDTFPHCLEHQESHKAGLDAMDRGTYSLILLDLGLPDSHGIETFRGVFREVRDTPIVILSGQSDEQLAIAAVQEGAEDFLPKNELTASLLVRTLRYAVERHELKLQAQFLAKHDPLTKAYNRHYFEETLAAEVARSHRYKHPIGFLMIDIDRFKAINDTYGHETGDFALKHVADYLRGQLRSVDYVIRYGGDEFLAILPETNGGTDALARRIADTKLRLDGEETEIQLTLSVGGSHWDPSSGDPIERALKEADEDMYRAKARTKQENANVLNEGEGGVLAQHG